MNCQQRCREPISVQSAKSATRREKKRSPFYDSAPSARVINWSVENRVQLNSDKCKKNFVFLSNVLKWLYAYIIIDGKSLETVSNAKLLGLTVSNNLTWNAHISELIKKASRSLYFLVQLKRANVPPSDLALLNVTCIRSILDYAVPLFHYSLSDYVMKDLERIHKGHYLLSTLI